jgi:hypothetical protein
MSAKTSVLGTVGNVLLLILLLTMLFVGYSYHYMCITLWDLPKDKAVDGLPSESSMTNMTAYLNSWMYMELAFPPDPGEPRVPVRWTADQPWATNDVPPEVVRLSNEFFEKRAAVFDDPNEEIIVRPYVIDWSFKGEQWVMFSQLEGEYGNLSFTGNAFPCDYFFDTLIPREYDEFKRGPIEHLSLSIWVDAGKVEVSFVPTDTTRAAIVLEPFSDPSVIAMDEDKLAKSVIASTGFTGPAGEFQIRALKAYGNANTLVFNSLAIVMLAFWVIVFIAAIIMMSRIRRQNRQIVTLNESAK